MSLSFEGSAIAIYGTSGTEMGNHMVTLDGQSATLNGGGDGPIRIHHDEASAVLVHREIYH